jgi:hypothetical protein
VSVLDLLDPLHGDGYQFWSGIGAALLAPALVGGAVWFWPKRCSELNCRRRATILHPQHGRPVCSRHLP